MLSPRPKGEEIPWWEEVADGRDVALRRPRRGSAMTLPEVKFPKGFKIGIPNPNGIPAYSPRLPSAATLGNVTPNVHNPDKGQAGQSRHRPDRRNNFQPG